MEDGLVMRSVYLRLSEDGLLRQLAYDLKVTKSDLIRAAISIKLRQWRESKSQTLVLKDLKSGQLEHTAESPVAPTKSASSKPKGVKIVARKAAPVKKTGRVQKPSRTQAPLVRASGTII